MLRNRTPWIPMGLNARTGSILIGNVLARFDRASACRPEHPTKVRASPKREGDRRGIDVGPPCRLIAVPVQLAMMEATNRDREFIADLAPECPWLGKAQMVRLGRCAAAHDAWLPGHEFAVLLVA